MSAKKTEFIINDLISKIFQQHYMDNRLPTQRKLASVYKVSRFTIQKVLKRMQAIGLIELVQGDGTYIREKARGNPLIYNSLTEVPYQELKSKVLYIKKIVPDSALAWIFNLEEGEQVWEFQRVRAVRSELNQVEIAYMPCSMFPELNKKAVEDSIQNYAMKQRYKLSYFMTNYTPCTLNREQAELLGSKKRTPAMEITSRGVLKTGEVFIYSKICAINYECTYIIPFNKRVHQSRRNKQ